MGLLGGKPKTAKNLRDVQGKDIRNVNTLIGPDCDFEGIIYLENSIVVEGTIRGKIECKETVVVGEASSVEADIIAEQVVVNGSVTGNIVAYEILNVGPTGRIRGDVEARQVAISVGGLLNGFCHMLSGTDENNSSGRRVLEDSSNVGSLPEWRPETDEELGAGASSGKP